jgi:hypothetical protein
MTTALAIPSLVPWVDPDCSEPITPVLPSTRIPRSFPAHRSRSRTASPSPTSPSALATVAPCRSCSKTSSARTPQPGSTPSPRRTATGSEGGKATRSTSATRATAWPPVPAPDRPPGRHARPRALPRRRPPGERARCPDALAKNDALVARALELAGEVIARPQLAPRATSWSASSPRHRTRHVECLGAARRRLPGCAFPTVALAVRSRCRPGAGGCRRAGRGTGGSA